MKRQAGATVLYLLFFLPILAGVASLAYELSVRSSLTNSLQSEIDRIALESADLLPDRAGAKIHAENELTKLSSHFKSTAVSVSAGRPEIIIDVQLERRAGPFELLTGVGSKLPTATFHAHSAAQLVPVDAAIILTDGVEMRPWRLPSGEEEEPWGDEANWPQSSAFDLCVEPPQRRPGLSGEWETAIGKRWITQSCFNPLFSNIKQTAIDLTDALAEVETNRLAVIFTPGAPHNGGIDVLRHIQRSPGGFTGPNNPVLGKWQPYADQDYGLGDEACVVLSDPILATSSVYALSNVSRIWGRALECPSPVDTSVCGIELHDASQITRPSCLLSSSIAEIIYYRSARHPEASFSATPNIFQALDEALKELSPVPDLETLTFEKNIRGKLALNPLKVIFLFSTHLPSIDQASPTLALLQTSGVALVVVHIRTNAPGSTVHSEQWREFIEGLPNTPFRRSTFISVTSPETLRQEVLPNLREMIHRSALKL